MGGVAVVVPLYHSVAASLVELAGYLKASVQPALQYNETGAVAPRAPSVSMVVTPVDPAAVQLVVGRLLVVPPMERVAVRVVS